MDVLTAAGLGLDYDLIRFDRTTEAWLAAGAALRNRVVGALAGVAPAVEVIGSSSVLNLLAKPIIDLAVGLDSSESVSAVTARLAGDGWIYRGDAGTEGGHVFVLESRPWHRVAHLHGVAHGGSQWRNYLRFRDLLRRSPEARDRYEAIKLELLERDPADRKAYTTGKTEVVSSLLREALDDEHSTRSLGDQHSIQSLGEGHSTRSLGDGRSRGGNRLERPSRRVDQ